MDGNDGKVVELPMVSNRKLTAKQERFAHLLANGLTKSDAYRKAYNAEGMKPETVHAEACKTAANPIVANRIDEIVDGIHRKMMNDSVRIRQHVLKGLLKESENRDDGSPATRLRALEMLGRLDIVDMFSRKAETPDNQRDAADIEKELKEKLRSLMR